MALIKCIECKKNMSDTLKACPHCGFKIVKPVKEVEPVKATEINTTCTGCGKSYYIGAKKCPYCKVENSNKENPYSKTIVNNKVDDPKPKSSHSKVVLLCILFVILIIVIYKGILTQAQRDNFNLFTKIAGVSVVVPWGERAETSVRVTTDGSKTVLANNIIGITHPTAVKPKLVSYDIKRNGDIINVIYKFNFEGGFLGGNYKLELSWKFSESQNYGISIISDTTALGIMPSQMEMLEKYFQTEMYPVVLGNAK